MTTSPRHVGIDDDPNPATQKIAAGMNTSPRSSAPMRFVVSVEPWSGGWDLHIDGAGLNSGGGVTQVTRLEDADTQVRDYLRSVFADDFSDAIIDIALPASTESG